jgi:hypothetical protein
MAVINAKAADEWTEKDIAQAPYDLRRVEGPAYTGHILMVFRMLCESVFTSDFLYRMYIGKNQLPQVGRRARARARGGGGGAATAAAPPAPEPQRRRAVLMRAASNTLARRFSTGRATPTSPSAPTAAPRGRRQGQRPAPRWRAPCASALPPLPLPRRPARCCRLLNPPPRPPTHPPLSPRYSAVPDAPERPEPGVSKVDSPASPAARVRAALASLGAALPTAAGVKGKKLLPKVRPTILEYHAAYVSGERVACAPPPRLGQGEPGQDGPGSAARGGSGRTARPAAAGAERGGRCAGVASRGGANSARAPAPGALPACPQAR